MKEIFKSINIYDFKEKYEISNKGIIFDCKNKRIVKCYDNKSGYKKVTLYSKMFPRGKKFYIHRLVAIIFIPNPNNLAIVNHLDKQRDNNIVENLEWCTISENNLHKFKSGNLKTHNAMKVEFYDKNKKFYKLFYSLLDACKFLKVHEKNSYRLKNIIIKNNFEKMYKDYYIKFI